MKLNLQYIENRLHTISADFAEKFIEAAQRALAKPEEIIGGALAIFVGFMMVGMAVHLFLPDIGPDWRDFVWWLFKVSAFFLICGFCGYVVLKAGREMDLNPIQVPQIPAKSAAADMQAPPYAIIYTRQGEDIKQFEQRAINAVNSKAPIIAIAFRDPGVLLRDADGTEVRALRGGMPWEDGVIPLDDIAAESYLDYMNYVRDFVRGFRRHVRCCLVDATDFSAQDFVRTECLPGTLPRNFIKASALAAFVLAMLLPLSAPSQTIEQVLGRRASEVPARNSEVSVITDKRVYTVIADGARNYVDLLRTRLGGLSWPTDVRMVVANDNIIAKAPSVERTQQAVRVGAATDAAQPVQQIPPRPQVDVRPEMSGGGKYIDGIAATNAIEEFKREGEGFFSEAWSVIRYAIRAFGHLITFLMILTRMYAYQAVNEMISTYLGRVWGGNSILSALMTLCTIQMFLVWAAGGYLLCEWSLFLYSKNIGVPWWELLTFAGSLVIIKVSKWFIISPRDVVDGSAGGSGGSRALMRG